jgi:hypothetical protein
MADCDCGSGVLLPDCSHDAGEASATRAGTASGNGLSPILAVSPAGPSAPERAIPVQASGRALFQIIFGIHPEYPQVVLFGARNLDTQRREKR